MPRFSQIWPVRAGHELPAKMSVFRMATCPALAHAEMDRGSRVGETQCKRGRRGAGEEKGGDCRLKLDKRSWEEPLFFRQPLSAVAAKVWACKIGTVRCNLISRKYLGQCHSWLHCLHMGLGGVV